ncbi:MAG: dockerin type I domain-containing protein [Planctomycetota bacterium]|nr:dockerin type I domain-containing protein [Planctomycetota bacterium]
MKIYDGLLNTCLVLGLLVSFSACLTAQEWSERPYETEIISAWDSMQDWYPDVRLERDRLGRTFLYGAPTSTGHTEQEAVDRFLEEHAILFGIFGSDLELIYETDLLDRAATVFAYRQVIDGVPVEYSAFRILVRPDLDTGEMAVVYAAGHLAMEPIRGYAPVVLTPEQALLRAREEMAAEKLPQWSEAELVIQASAALRDSSRLVYRVSAMNPDPSEMADWSVLVDPEFGDILEVRNEIIHTDIAGAVRGRVNQNNRPDTATNPAVDQVVGRVPVAISGGSSTFAEVDGSFLIPHGGTAPVNLNSSLVGQWVVVQNEAGANLSVTTPTTPPGPATVELNPLPNVVVQAEVNGFHYTNITHDFYRDRTFAGNPGIDIAIDCNVNIVDTCNAFYSPGAQSINFYQEGGGCVNTAYASVVSHEYGHFIVNRLGLGQGAFGEGFGDLMSILIYDDPIIGHDFLGPGTEVRDPVAANVQYPCPQSAVHFCGQILGASFWRIRDNLGNSLGSAEGLAVAQQLAVDWSLITIGGSGSSSAHPQTAIEALTVDDDDGSIDNGTPNFAAICDAFAQHSIDCPALPDILITYPEGRPETLLPLEAAPIRLLVVAGTATPDAATGQLLYRQGAAAFQSVALQPLGADQYLGTIPPQDCGELVQYYFSFQDIAGASHFSPSAGAGSPFEVAVISELNTVVDDSMEVDLGWSVGAPTDTATTGVWIRTDPLGTGAAPELDHSEVGTLCWVTGQGSVGGSLGENDVDGGATTLFSPVFDMATGVDPASTFSIKYWRWYSTGTGAAPYADTFVIEISSDLATWVNVETVGPANGPDTNGGWIQHSFDPSLLVPLTNTIQMRFIASDLDAGSVVEAGIDDFEVVAQICNQGPSFLRGDPNGDGSVDISDAVAILAYLFDSVILSCVDAADFADSGTVNISDAVALVSYLFSGGDSPSFPFPQCGLDPTDDTLSDCIPDGVCP